MYQGLSLIDWLTCTPCRGLNFKGGGGGGGGGGGSRPDTMALEGSGV